MRFVVACFLSLFSIAGYANESNLNATDANLVTEQSAVSSENMQKLWGDWNTAILSQIPKESEYYTLTNGVSDEQIKELESQLGFSLPPTLVDFYKVHNVKPNYVTSAFTLTGIDEMGYYIIPFEKIFYRYESIMGWNNEYADDDNPTDEYDEKIRCEIYANPKWIPFAENLQGDYFMIDTDPSEKGNMYQIIDLQNDSWKRIVIADSLETLIRDNIRKINNKEDERFEFILSELDNED